MVLGGDFTPVDCPVNVTAGDNLILLDPLAVFTEVEGVEEEVTLTGASATVKKKRLSTAAVVLDLEVTRSENVVTFPAVAVPDLPGEYWWDLEVAWSGTAGITIVGGHFHILPQATVPT